VSVEQHFRYLGIVFHETKGCRVAAELLADSGLKASYALLEGAEGKGIQQSAFLCRMFDMLVGPVLSYGCQIWGPCLHGALTHKRIVSRSHVPAEGVHLDFLRQLGGLPSSSSCWVTQAEFGRQPLLLRWLRLAARFLDKALSAEGTIMHEALVDNVQLWLDGDEGCWFAQLHAAAVALGVPGVTAGDAQQLTSVEAALQLPISESTFETAGDTFLRGFWGVEMADADPTQVQAGVAACTYRQWVVGGVLPSGAPPPAPHLPLFASTRLKQALIRLRVTSYPLRIMTDRYHRPVRPREQRTCMCCAQAPGEQAPVEDLQHFLLHCPCYGAVRQRHAVLFPPGATTASVLGAADQYALALAVWDMLQTRQRKLEHNSAQQQAA
jgi:hypothetical protein